MLEVERERQESDVTYTYTKSGIRFAINVPEEPTATQVTGIEKFLANADTAIRSKKASEYTKYIDLDSFVNYYIVSEIFKAVDFNYSSTRFYVKNGKMYAGPIWDLDLSSGNASKRFYQGYYNGDKSYEKLHCTEFRWYYYLIRSDEFVSKVNARMKAIYPKLQNMYQSNSLGSSRIATLLNTYRASFERNYASVENGGAGWSIVKRYSTCDNAIGLELDNHANSYGENVELLRVWLKNRVTYLEKEWKKIKNNAVEDLTISKKGSTAVKLEWYNSGNSDGNEIYMKAPNGKYKLVKTVKDGTKQTCVIKNVTPGVKYSYRVRSYVQYGTVKVYTDYVSKSKALSFKSPKAKAKAISGKQWKITWKKAEGAQGYEVRGGVSKKKMKKLATIKGNKKKSFSKKVKGSKKYTFKIVAYVKVNGKKYYSK
jgi:hypothetical protein